MFLGMAILCIITYVSVRYIHTDAMQLISFFYIFLRLAQAASEASSSLTRLQLCMPGMRILYDWNLQCEKALARPKLEKKIIEQEDISIEGTNISFEFIKNKPLFTNLNFKLKSSEVFIIKGESGAGKSTLLSLILGFQPPSKGSIKINSFSTTEYTLDLHRVLAYVGPEPYIIQGTLKENLLYGLEESEEIPESSLWDALEKMELKTLVEKLPLKLNEPVHDIPQLSTGQKQRLSFARALLRKPSLLILDEATANLDSATEKRIINNLKDLFKNCTSIIVTHKGSFDDLGTYSLELDNSNSSTHI